MKMLKKNLYLKRFLIIGLLLGLWGFLTLLYIFNYNLSFSVISYPHPKENINNFSTQRFFAGDKVSGEFVAKEYYLGIVNISFSIFDQVPYNEEDILIFRLREKGENDWYYENTYRSGLIYDVPFLPFGFPIIVDSKGKTYEFEIESLRGNEVNAVALNSWEPVLLSRYQIPSEDLIQDRNYLLSFFTKKITVSLSNPEVLFFSFIYSLPLLFYLLIFIPPGRNIFMPILSKYVRKLLAKTENITIFWYKINTKNSGGYLCYVLVFIVLINIFIIPALNDLALIIVGALWFMAMKNQKRDHRSTFLIGIIFLLIAPVSLELKNPEMAERAAVWAYMFFVAGAILIFMEISKSEKNTSAKKK